MQNFILMLICCKIPVFGEIFGIVLPEINTMPQPVIGFIALFDRIRVFKKSIVYGGITAMNCEALTETIEKTLWSEVKPISNPGLELYINYLLSALARSL